MSHFTYMTTRFRNKMYLEKAFNKLDIVYKESNVEDFNSSNINLIIPQSNNYDIKFVWNGQEYELVTDMSFWKQPYTVESFIDKIAKQYAVELIGEESQKIGFQRIKYESNSDGSNIIVLDRWNAN